MKSPATAALLAESSPSVTASSYHQPNAEGIYESPEWLVVPIGGGSICHIFLAHTEDGWIGGFKFFMKSPRNLLEQPPRVGDQPLDTRELAIAEMVKHARSFFHGHQSLLARLDMWVMHDRGEAPAAAREVIQETTLPLNNYYATKMVSGVVCVFEWDAAGIADAYKHPRVAKVLRSVEAPNEIDARSRAERLFAEGAGEDSWIGQVSSEPAGTPAIEASEPDATIPPRPHYAEIPVDAIEPGDNPRKSRAPDGQAELVESIRANGLLQPIAVRDMGAGREGKPDAKRYRLIFGEGRWLAHTELGRATIEAKIYHGVDDAAALALALVENLQRRDMNSMDEAEGFADLSRMGWTPERMSEQTGKAVRTIYRSLALMKLPESVRAQVRAAELSARQARELVRWVAANGEKSGALVEGFISRPEVCEVIARVAGKSAENIPSEDLAAGIPPAAVAPLIEAKALIEINAAKYFDEIHARGLFADCPESGKYFRLGSDAQHLYCWPETGWPTLKKTIDKAMREAADEQAARAQRRVETAATSKVSVPLTALKEAGADHVILKGELERYAEHLPESIMTTGIDPNTKGEVILCTDPKKLQALRDAEAKAVKEHDDALIALAVNRAELKIKKLKKVGRREWAVVMTAALDADYSPRVEVIGWEAWKAQGLKMPHMLLDTSAASTWGAFAKIDPVACVRAYLQALLLNLQELGDRAGLAELLRWILEVPKLGIMAEDPRERDKLLRRLAATLFAAPAAVPPPVEKVPAKAAAKPSKKPTKAKGVRK
jgi:ParB/RepB/Spo0J family partition protein